MEMANVKVKGALHSPTEAETETTLDEIGHKKLTELKAMTGAGFDKAYVIAKLDGHRKLLRIQEDYLKVGQKREHFSLTKLARPDQGAHRHP